MDHNLLVSELQSLILESKRRNPEVKDAGERALELLKGGPLSKEDAVAHSGELLAPITLGCKTKIAKIVGISIAALQRLVALGGVPTEALPGVLATLTSVANQAVDIQLKILQTLLSILTFNRDVHEDVLGQALLLCFKLQDSRVSVVSSTAAATLRQAVMVVFDRISTSTETPSIPLHLPSDPPVELTITPSAMDAFSLLSDLCLLTASGSGGSGLSLWATSEKEKPKILRLSSLHRTFGLELIESILSGYEEGVKQRPELLYLMRNSLAPLLLKLQAEKPTFPIALRVCRLIFLLIRSFSEQLPLEVETFLSVLIRLGMDAEGEEGPGAGAKKDHVVPWLRVLALEILRGICGDITLLQKLFNQYDQPGGPALFSKLVSSLGRLVSEKPALLGIGAQMHGVGVPSTDVPSKDAGYFDMGLGMVASAASVGVSTVSSMMGTMGGGLGSHSGLKLRLIEQHDKTEAPAVPETYIYLLALQSLDAISEGIFNTTAQSTEAPPAIKGMAQSAWPALLAALSYCIGTNLSDGLFAEALGALQDFTIACGLLGLNTPRDAFLATLGKYAVPPPVVSAMQTYMEAPNTGRNNSVIGAEALGLAALGVGAPIGPPGLSERNLACLKSTVTTARVLSGSLGEAWHDVLEVLQNANFLLAAKKINPNLARRPTMQLQLQSPSIGGPRTSMESTDGRHEAFNDLDAESIQSAINVLFDGTKELDDKAFSTFVAALCRLSSEMIGLNNFATSVAEPIGSSPPSPMSPTMALSPSEGGRRRTSGLNISHSIKSGERSFSLTKLRTIATLNLPRLVNCDPEIGWNVITQHLLSVARHVTAPSTIRIQASDTLGEILLAAVRIGKEPRVQHQVFGVLVRQVDPNPISSIIATDYDVRSAGYQTLNQILESSGHSLEVGWQTIFNMLNAVCKNKANKASESTSVSMNRSESSLSASEAQRPTSLYSKGDAVLVRIAFPSLNLICTDFLSSLDADAMRQCITCLGCFGRQEEDVNITLAAIGLLWNVSDAVQGTDKDLWLCLLTELLELGRDSRLEVRSSAMQTLFRCIELYGSSLSPQLWEDVLWKVVFPLLDTTTPDESQILALTSLGTIFNSFLQPLSALDSFEKVYTRLLDRLKQSFIVEPRQCCTAALKALERVLLAVDLLAETDPSTAASILDLTWLTFVEMGEALNSSGEPYTQENLVALVRIASLLHEQLSWIPDRLRQLSTILRGIMTYTRSPEYRPDVDVMSPLQSSICELVASSTKLGPSIVLSDLAEYASLAYVGDAASGNLTYVAVSKFAMPRMKEVFARNGEDKELYEDGTVESVLAAYGIPIKLKYDCPAPSRYGNDQPLWGTAMTNFAPVLDEVVAVVGLLEIPSARFEAIWSQITDILSGILLADSDNTQPEQIEEDESFVLPLLDRFKASIATRLGDPRVPVHTIEHLGETLRKASRLYRQDVPSRGGTTAPAISDAQERMRYWAFNFLVALSSRGDGKVSRSGTGTGTGTGTGRAEIDEHGKEGRKKVARGVMPALIWRFEDSIKAFLEDAKMRGQMPFPRVREEELLFVLRQLATLRVWPETVAPKQASPVLSSAYSTSSRSHLFRFYPMLLDLSFVRCPLPSMWVFPSEQARLFARYPTSDPSSRIGTSGDGEETLRVSTGSTGSVEGSGASGESQSHAEISAGDGGDLIEVNARDIARRCLEVIGEELGLQ